MSAQAVNEAFARLTETMTTLAGPASRQDSLARATRMVEALLFAAPAPLSGEDIARILPADVALDAVMAALIARYHGRGITLEKVAGKWAFRTASDLSYLISPDAPEPKKLSRAVMETLAIIAYHQPVTRAEIEEIRGVGLWRGTLDLLLEAGWVRMRGRRRTPGRPVTFGTTEAFLVQFGLDRLSDLPGLDEMRGAGLIGTGVPDFAVPLPSDDPALRADEDALEADLFDQMAEERRAEEEPALDPDDDLTHDRSAPAGTPAA